MELDNIKFRRLENGWTVKYHLSESPAPESKKFGGEIYVRTRDGLQECVLALIEKHIPREQS